MRVSGETKGNIGTEILAVELAKRYGFHVFPVYEIDEKTLDCTCPRNSETRRSTGICKNPGKHPATGKGGHKNATNDIDEIKALWKKRPFANVGIACGPSKLIVLDADMHRVDGIAALRGLEQTYGPLPDTVQVLTGGGGMHYVLRKPEHVKTKLKQESLIPGAVDVRSDGGYIVAPPSLHKSGRRYEWEAGHHPEDTPIATCPMWVIDRLSASDQEFEASTAAVIDGFMGKAFRAAGWLGSAAGPGKAAALCPWEKEHTVGGAFDGSTVVFAPNAGEVRGHWWCSHSHCSGRTQAEVLEQLPAHAKRIAAEAEPPRPSVSRAAPEARPAKPGDSTAAPTPPQPDWRGALRYNDEGRVTKEPGNASLFLAHLDEWRGVLAYDDFRLRVQFLREPPFMPGFERPCAGFFGDDHLHYVRHWLSLHKHMALPKEAVLEAVRAAAQVRRFHPVRDYLSSLSWDREPRLDVWLAAYFGAEHTDYSARIGAAWMISAVARVFQPGCKVDTMPVIEGEQGEGKSQALRILAGEWFTDHLPDVTSKDAMLQLSGIWILEWGELAGISKHDAEKVKQFVTVQIDRYRAPFERITGDHPRQCVFVGSTNHDTYLRDPTGNRRFWPIRAGRLNLEALAKDRDQLWAEAVHRYRAHERWWLDREGEGLALVEQSARRVQEAWLPDVAEYVEKRAWVTVAEILTESRIRMDRDKISQPAMNSVAACLKEMGWVRDQQRVNGHRVWGYVPTAKVAA